MNTSIATKNLKIALSLFIFSCSIFSFDTKAAANPNIVITQGGVYTGTWSSTNPNLPAVQVLTSQPVTIQNCQIYSTGNGIESLSQNANLTVRNCYAQGFNPNILNQQKGSFINVGLFSNVSIQNNTIVSYGQGIRALNYGTNATTINNQVLTIRYNSFKNVDGRFSAGNNGYLSTYRLSSGQGPGSAIILNTLRSAKVDIGWNQIINQPFQSAVEDVISIFNSSGLSGNSILIHDNYIQGTYPPNPADRTLQYTGLGINIGDSSNNIGYTHVYNNHVVSFLNGGIGITGGNNNEVNNNRIISASIAPDGNTVLGGAYRSTLSLVNFYNSSFWYNNNIHDNTTNVVDENGNDTAPYNVSSGSTNGIFNTTDQFGFLITQDEQTIEYQVWLNDLLSAQVNVGCSGLSGVSGC